MDVNNKKLDKYSELKNMVSDLQEQVKNLEIAFNQMVQSNNKFLEIIETDVPTIRLRNKMKKTGKEHPRYRSDIDTDELIKDYVFNGYQITQEMLDMYNIDGEKVTYSGLRARLKNAGVWKSREDKKEEWRKKQSDLN